MTDTPWYDPYPDATWRPQIKEEQETVRVRFAGLSARWVGGAIDFIAPNIVFSELFGSFGSTLLLAFIVFNSVWMQGRTGQSLGKRLLGLRLCRIVDSYNDYSYYVHVTPGLCFGRLVAHVLDVMPFLYGFIRPVFSPRAQTYADSVAHTVVIKDDPRLRIWDMADVRAQGDLR